MEFRLLGGRVDIETSFVEADDERIREEVREYAEGSRTSFSLPVAFPDSFTGDVMAAMDEIPFGKTRTYGDIAAELDTAAVAVGQAAGRNPVPLLIPCHRVVSGDGLGGYSAAGGTALKERLLQHEGALE